MPDEDSKPTVSPNFASRPDPSLPGGILLFLATLGALALVRVLLGYVSFPLGALPVIDLVLAALFVGAPILALFYGANARWTWQTATVFVVGGLALQAAIMAFLSLVRVPPQAEGILVAIAQIALPCWCVGLGALLATLIKEKNIILPIAIFLAGYDFFLVLSPQGPTQRLLKAIQPVFTKVAGQVPAASAAPTHGLAHAGAFIGMADFVFLAMFFIALFRFRMRTRATLYAIIPALIVYLLIVLLFGSQTLFGFSLSALPALVPIGLTVLAVNWKEFKLTRDERLSTLVLAIIAIGVVTWVATRPAPPPEPSQSVPAPRQQK